MSHSERESAPASDTSRSERSGADRQIVEETSKKIRSFLYELAEGTSNYRSLHSLTEQVEHQYHGRFLVELIQNAHDALFTREDHQGHTGRIEIVFHPKEGTHGSLYVANDGHCFSSSNFRSLSQLGQSDKDPQESIGNKGIGFRSILEIADSPEVYSRSQEGSPSFDGFCFSFSPVIISRITEPALEMSRSSGGVLSVFRDIPLVDWDSRLIEKFRAAVRGRGESWLAEELGYLSPYLLPFPIRREDTCEAVLDFERRGLATVMRFPSKSAAAAGVVERKMDELDAGTLLFLDRATSVVFDNGTTRRELFRESSALAMSGYKGREVRVTQAGCDESRKYWSWSKAIQVADAPDELQAAVLRLPGKWPQIKEVTVSIAVRVGEGPDQGIFSIFLPTPLRTGCATHINAAFCGDMSRTHIDFENAYNRFLVDEAAALAVNVVAHELAGRGDNEALAIVDLLAPLDANDKASTLWRDLTERACPVVGIDIDEAPLFLADSGWTALNKTSLLPPISSPIALTPQLLRTHATFDVFREVLDSRTNQLRALAARYPSVGVYPMAESIAETLEAVAAHCHTHAVDFDWNGFWTDAGAVLNGDSTPLQRKAVVLGNDGELHSSGKDCAVFFIPRQGGLDDEELANEGAVLDIPATLNPHIAFLSDKIRVYDESNARVQTPVRRFLDTKLVNRFRVEDIFNRVLIPRTPALPIPLDSADAGLCQDILSWGLRLVSNLAGREKGERSLRLLKDLPVPCLGGWFPIRETTFGPGWPGLGDTILRYLNGAGTRVSSEAAQKLLLPPTDQRWAGGAAHQDLLRAAGVFDGIRLLTVSPDAWRSTLYASRYHFKLPEVGPPAFAQDFWDAYCGFAQSNGRPRFEGTFSYEVQSFSVIPGCERYTELDEATQLALMEAVLGSIGKWEGKWERLQVRKTEGSGDVIELKSPLAYWLRIRPWLGIHQGDECHWFRPAQRWHVPAAALAGRAWQFAHLKPLPGSLADQLDADTELSDAMRRLGMPKFDPEFHSSSTRLLTDLANAAKGDEIPDQNVFLGQVRSAWTAFYPKPGKAHPESILVKRSGHRLTAERPSAENPVYLPDSPKSFVAALEHFELLVVAIETAEARRLAEWFQTAYGDGLQKASELDVVPLVDGLPWNGVAGERLRDSELTWLIPVILTLTAFGGSQPKGTASKRFREQIVSLREARVTWAAQLQAGLFRGETKVSSPSTDAFWRAEDRVLLVAEACRENLSLLAEALSLLLEREDLEVSLKLLLKEFQGLEPDQPGIERALNQLRLSPTHFREVLEHWRGDVGQIIRMVLPLVEILTPDAPTGALFELDSDEAVTAFLDSLSDARIDGKQVIAMARNSADISEFGMKAFRRFGDVVQLDAWNKVLELRGEAASVNREAAAEFKAHIGAAIQPLRCLLASIAARPMATDSFRELSSQLDGLSCPGRFAHQLWDVTFSHVLCEVIPHLILWTATASEVDAVRQAVSPEDLIERLRQAGVDVATDPIQTARDNRDKVKDSLTRLQQFGLAWALANGHQNPADWESRADGYFGRLSKSLEDSDFIAPWSDADVFAFFATLPRDEASAAFWSEVSQSADFGELSVKLGLSPQEISDAKRRLTVLREDAQRRKKLVSVCGREFDSSEDNLTGLWAHVCLGIPDDVLDTLTPFDVRKPSLLTDVKKPAKSKGKDRAPGKIPKRKYQSKSMEQMIGLAGEIHAFRMLQRIYGAASVSSSSWVSGNSTYVYPDNATDDGAGCDVMFTHMGRTYNIEVKATEGEDESFTLGSSEIRLAMELARKGRRRRKGHFLVLRVTNALSDHPSFHLLPNPYDPRFQPRFLIEEAGARVRYKAVAGPRMESQA